MVMTVTICAGQEVAPEPRCLHQQLVACDRLLQKVSLELVVCDRYSRMQL